MKLLTLFCLVTTTSASLAEVNAYFFKHDSNSDGHIDKTEFYAVTKAQLEKEGKSFSAQVAEQRFFSRDKDQNGVLSTEEFNGKAEHNKKWGYFKKTDSNEDGFVSKEEFAALTKKQFAKDGVPKYEEEAEKRFNNRDADKDGKLSVQEFFLFHLKKARAPEPKLTRS